MNFKNLFLISVLINVILVITFLFSNSSLSVEEVDSIESTFSQSTSVLEKETKYAWMGVQIGLDKRPKY